LSKTSGDFAAAKAPSTRRDAMPGQPTCSASSAKPYLRLWRSSGNASSHWCSAESVPGAEPPMFTRTPASTAVGTEVRACSSDSVPRKRASSAGQSSTSSGNARTTSARPRGGTRVAARSITSIASALCLASATTK